MCGFIQRKKNDPTVAKVFDLLDQPDLFKQLTKNTKYDVENFYPAFGGAANRKITGIVIQTDKGLELLDATWWFDCQPTGKTLEVGKRTTFNARNLDSTFWKGAYRHNRGLVIATAFGESSMVGKTKHQYLMEGNKAAIILGAVYRRFDNGQACCAVITREATSEFAEFHEKAMPLMLPAKKTALKTWLHPDIKESPIIDDLVANPTVRTGLKVTKVKSFKSGTPVNDETYLLKKASH